MVKDELLFHLHLEHVVRRRLLALAAERAVGIGLGRVVDKAEGGAGLVKEVKVLGVHLADRLSAVGIARRNHGSQEITERVDDYEYQLAGLEVFPDLLAQVVDRRKSAAAVVEPLWLAKNHTFPS